MKQEPGHRWHRWGSNTFGRLLKEIHIVFKKPWQEGEFQSANVGPVGATEATGGTYLAENQAGFMSDRNTAQ